MNPQAFDDHARRLHGASLDALGRRVQAQLAQRRRAALAPRARGMRWGWLGGVAATAGALALALHVMPLDTTGPGPATPSLAVAAPWSDPALPVAEDPDFYLWLASGDAVATAE